MGEVAVEIGLENTVDRLMARRGLLNENAVRLVRLRVIAGRGALMLALPQEVVEAVGIDEVRRAVVTYADSRKEERAVAGPVTVSYGDRSATVDCVVLPRGNEPLLGQVPLELMDLLVDCGQRQLIPRPDSSSLPLIALR